MIFGSSFGENTRLISQKSKSRNWSIQLEKEDKNSITRSDLKRWELNWRNICGMLILKERNKKWKWKPITSILTIRAIVMIGMKIFTQLNMILCATFAKPLFKAEKNFLSWPALMFSILLALSNNLWEWIILALPVILWFPEDNECTCK